jgi:hypothetical protein
MGSWNDQSFDGDEAAQFEAVSSTLFWAMNDYLASLLTVEPGEASADMRPVYLALPLRL